MRLRTIGLIVTLALGILSAPLAADAQRPGRVYRIGVLLPGAALSEAERQRSPLRAGLRELGYVEGENIAFEVRSAEFKAERLPGLAVEIARLKVDVIFALGTPAVQASRQATTTIPIVMAGVGDPVESGLVSSLARPGGNVTGMSLFGPAVWAKQLELLKEAAPGISRVALLRDPMNRAHGIADTNVDAAAKALRVVVQRIDVRTAADLGGALAAILRQHAEAVLLYPLRIAPPDLQRIADFAIKNRLPSSYGFRDFVDVGGLMSYGPSLAEQARRWAVYIDKILKGAKPADLPVENPTRYEMIINLKTAKALGLTIPQSVLIRADQVIE